MTTKSDDLNENGELQLLVADYTNPAHGMAIISLMDSYASEGAGGGKPLSEQVKNDLVNALDQVPGAFSVLCFGGDQAIGLMNCFQGFSTFKCQPLINIHDVVVVESHRGKGICAKMLSLVEQVARERGCCKVTLEVQEGNRVARVAYQKSGYSCYELNPDMGHALFWQKTL
ncbi:MAG: GNAT family N-acetyltransferase [Proteobacteria bacterium]|nr:MAG: GNAT family N-acetyltransferase [Pseudomonadota bacterium]PIE40491.1 MAG: GNAT family N-acetyltransferase [Gammaproteobacteria bacterium]